MTRIEVATLKPSSNMKGVEKYKENLLFSISLLVTSSYGNFPSAAGKAVKNTCLKQYIYRYFHKCVVLDLQSRFGTNETYALCDSPVLLATVNYVIDFEFNLKSIFVLQYMVGWSLNKYKPICVEQKLATVKFK